MNANTAPGRTGPARTDPRAQPQLQDTKVDVKIALAGLWTAMLFLFAFVDIFGFFRADIIAGALAGRVPDVDVTINQAFLAGAVAYVAIPCLMIIVSLLTPAKLNRRLNIAVSFVYAITIVGLCIGESWIYYLLGSALEVVILLLAVRIAWRWPHAESRTT